MVNQEILSGLKFALSKGQTLKRAMMSFYNAGYSKSDIEEAARAIQTEQFSQQTQPPQTQKQQAQVQKQVQQIKKSPVKQVVKQYQPQVKKPATKLKLPTDPNKPKRVAPVVKTPVKPTQVVSSYGQKSNELKKKNTFTFVMLLIFLIFLLVALAGVFFYKQELIDFFNGLF